MDSRGTISDHILYLNQSNYDKLPALGRRNLDIYLDDCSNHYTLRTLELTRIYCSSGLLFLDDIGIHDISDVTYDSIIKLIKTKCIALMIQEPGYGIMLRVGSGFMAKDAFVLGAMFLLLTVRYNPHIGLLSEFSNESLVTFRNITDVTLPVDSFYNIIKPFIHLLEAHGYAGTTLKLSKHALISLYLFLDMNHLGFHPDIMWIWFAEIRKRMGDSWLHWRRVLKFYKNYAVTSDIHPDGKYKYHPISYDKLPLWCREPIEGLLEQKRREFREPATIDSYMYSCTRFCIFLLDHGYDSFKYLSFNTVKGFPLHDKHASFKERAICFVAVRAFLRYLDEKGYTDVHKLDMCLMTGAAPCDKIIDVLSDGQVQRINTFCTEHNGPIELRDIPIVLLGLRMGLRAYDVLSLRFQSISGKRRERT